MASAREKLTSSQKACRWCGELRKAVGLSSHEKGCRLNPENEHRWHTCAACGQTYYQRYLSRTQLTCSRGCSNKLFPRWTEDKLKRYRSICFRGTPKKCCVCAESNVVEVHHLNGDSSDNLVPLCPTHHRYWHSRFKALIEDAVLAWVDRRREERKRLN